MTEVVGLVLAAGAGRRFGGPKALVRDPATGLTFVERAIKDLYAAGLARVFVVTGAAGADVDALVRGAGASPVRCADWTEGMGASLTAGLRVISQEPSSAVLVTLVDLPDVRSPVHVRLTRASADLATQGIAPTAVLLRAAYQGVPGHPVLMGRDHWAGVLATASGDRGARAYLAEHPAYLVECGDLATGRDVDRPEDLIPPSG